MHLKVVVEVKLSHFAMVGENATSKNGIFPPLREQKTFIYIEKPPSGSTNISIRLV